MKNAMLMLATGGLVASMGLAYPQSDTEKVNTRMLGAIAGDVVGSVFEHRGLKNTEFPLFGSETTFTDDTVLTVAVAAAILGGREYGETIRDFGRRYPGRGYGDPFFCGFTTTPWAPTTAGGTARRCVYHPWVWRSSRWNAFSMKPSDPLPGVGGFRERRKARHISRR